jgi:tetratricopeptide (TPR) repeat protein
LGLASVQAVDRLQAQQVKYTPKEYEAFTKAIQEPDLGKRANGIVSCMKEYPKSELTEYAVSNYLQVMQQYRSKGQPRQVASAGEKLLTLQPGNLHALFWTAEAFFQTREFAKAARYGEKAYAAKNDSGLAFVLASSYLELKDDRRLLLYGEKACAKLAPKDCYQILGELTRILAANEQWSKAASYAKKSIEGFEAAKKPAQTPQKEWNDYVNRQKAVAYAVLGRHAAENRKWRTARSNYQKALGESSNPGLKGEAYYYIGLGHWRGNRIDPAMEAFAKGAVQRGAPHARHCRRSLEKLYKSTHNDSLAGIDEFIQRVGR